jgi:TonB family protein
MLTAIAFLLSMLAPGQAPALRQPACGVIPAADAALAEACQGDDELRAAESLTGQAVERRRRLEAAAAHYQRSATLASKPEVRARALDALTKVYDPQHLDEPRQVENALRELMANQPEDLAPVFRLAKLLEDEGLTDAAEDTLLSARRQRPDGVEPYRMLAQYYARRATALSRQSDQPSTPAAQSSPGERDENGIYRVGGPIAAPSRLDVARYPPEAAAAGIQGNVLAEIVINEAGNVTDAKIVRSIPMLDEAALQAVRNWHFAPTMVNGQSVPVRMVVTVNFTTAR